MEIWTFRGLHYYLKLYQQYKEKDRRQSKQTALHTVNTGCRLSVQEKIEECSNGQIRNENLSCSFYFQKLSEQHRKNEVSRMIESNNEVSKDLERAGHTCLPFTFIIAHTHKTLFQLLPSAPYRILLSIQAVTFLTQLFHTFWFFFHTLPALRLLSACIYLSGCGFYFNSLSAFPHGSYDSHPCKLILKSAQKYILHFSKLQSGYLTPELCILLRYGIKWYFRFQGVYAALRF